MSQRQDQKKEGSQNIDRSSKPGTRPLPLLSNGAAEAAGPWNETGTGLGHSSGMDADKLGAVLTVIDMHLHSHAEGKEHEWSLLRSAGPCGLRFLHD